MKMLVKKTEEKKMKDVTFSYLCKKVEESEHSLEMQLPYIYKIFADAGRIE